MPLQCATFRGLCPANTNGPDFDLSFDVLGEVCRFRLSETEWLRLAMGAARYVAGFEDKVIDCLNEPNAQPDPALGESRYGTLSEQEVLDRLEGRLETLQLTRIVGNDTVQADFRFYPVNAGEKE